jgi:hypothetical protein
MEQILDKLDNFYFDIEFNDINIYKLNLAKKIKPIMFQFMCIEKFINESENITQNVINNYVNIQKKLVLLSEAKKMEKLSKALRD